MEKRNGFQMASSNDVIILEDIFFVRENAIKNNSEIAKEALKDIFNNISFN